MKNIDTYIEYLDPSKHYIVAVSFGVDSMVLLDACVRQGLSVHVAHVNYHRRKESDSEQHQLEQYCFLKDIPLSVLDVTSYPKGNFQAVARDIRYEFFAQLKNEGHGDVLLTAHHLDDHLETALFQERRKAFVPYLGLESKATRYGMDVIRPLLTITKKDIYAYQQLHNVPYSEDVTNASSMYTRNVIRKELQGWSNSQRVQLLQRINLYNEMMKKIKTNLEIEIKSYRFSTARYQSYDIKTKFMFWVEWFNHFSIRFDVSQSFLLRVEQFLKSKKPNIKQVLTSEWTLYKAYDHLALIHHDWMQPYAVQLHRPRQISTPLFSLNTQHFREAPYPLVFRNGNAKDKVTQGTITKSLRRIMIDWKVPLYLRPCYPVLISPQQNRIFVPYYEVNSNDKKSLWMDFIG